MYKTLFLLSLTTLLISCNNSGENNDVVENGKTNNNIEKINNPNIVVDGVPPKNESNFITNKDLGEK